MNLAYAAGIFDGEGCVGFARARTSIFPRVLIVNTCLPLLERFKASFGGDIKPLAGRKEGWKQAHMWRISWSRAVNFLEKISPSIQVKREQLSTIFAWDAVREGRGKRADAGAVELLVRRMTWLNAKGPVRGVDPIDEVLEAVA